MSNIEKSAMTPAERSRYLKAAVAAAITAAGVGAFARGIKAKKDAKKNNDIENSKNAIIVEVAKDSFLKDLPKPDELAKMRGEGSPSASSPSMTSGDMSAEDIAAKKKDILRGRKFNFFGGSGTKIAQDNSNKDSPEKPEGKSDKSKDRKDDDGVRVFLRDQEGRFVSPTDPAAVEQVEKEANDSSGDGYDWSKLLRVFTNPIESGGVVWDAMTSKPVMLSAGVIGSIALAAKISDTINKIRTKRSKENLNSARNEYVKLLESGDGTDKVAEEKDPRAAVGTVLGATVALPFAITAMVMNRVYENRREEKRKEKDRSNSFPDEPIILYKTSEAKEIEISPETALAVMIVKQAMISRMEGIESGCVMEKGADFGWKNLVSPVLNTIIPGAGQVIGDTVVNPALEVGKKKLDQYNQYKQSPAYGLHNYVKDGKLTDEGWDYMGSSGFNTNLYNIVNGFTGGSENGNMEDLLKSNPELRKTMSGIISDPRMTDLLISRFNDPRYASTWGAMRNRLLDQGLKKYWGDGSVMYHIMTLLSKIPFIGNWMFSNGLKDQIAGYSNKINSMGTPGSQASAGNSGQTSQTASASK